MSDLDRIFSELSEISMQLADLPQDAYDDRARLESRREELHREAATISEQIGDERPTAVIQTELESLRDQLRQIEGSEIDVVSQHGGSGLESSGASNALELNRQIEAGQGADELRSRIRRLERVLSERDEA
ncbi:MAG: hypothetical protein QNJ77_10765 [Acidimicrobiia bacterium]|nr:hypothetical protein [Acidimicrobiia bacterium]